MDMHIDSKLVHNITTDIFDITQVQDHITYDNNLRKSTQQDNVFVRRRSHQRHWLNRAARKRLNKIFYLYSLLGYGNNN